MIPGLHLRGLTRTLQQCWWGVRSKYADLKGRGLQPLKNSARDAIGKGTSSTRAAKPCRTDSALAPEVAAAARTSLRHNFCRRLLEDQAAQLVEFAVALPLLVVFVVGIFDFSGAFTLKQKLTNTARDAARAAAADPITDMLQPPTPMPSSISDAYQLVSNYLVANNVDMCGLTSANGISGPGPIWTFSVPATSSAPCGITIIVNRGYYLPATGTAQLPNVNCRPVAAASGQTQVVATCVSIQYAYQWRFGKVQSVLGASASLPNNISAVAVATNEN